MKRQNGNNAEAAGEAGEERATRTGAEAGVGHGHLNAGRAGLQAPLQLLDLPPDLLPLRVQVEARGDQRGLSAGGAAGPGRARPPGHGDAAGSRAWAAAPHRGPAPSPSAQSPLSPVARDPAQPMGLAGRGWRTCAV